jgi:hypothetical protein
MAQIKKEVVTLDPDDPFDAALIPILQTNRRKRADYARDGDPFSSFRTSSSLLGLTGFGPVEAGLFNITQKLSRLKSLRENGRMDDPQNEAVADTYLDLAVYGVLVYAMALWRRPKNDQREPAVSCRRLAVAHRAEEVLFRPPALNGSSAR